MITFAAPQVLFEDDDLLAVMKPAGLLSQQSSDKKNPHVLSWVEQHLGLKTALHHRLDKDTSGVMILGKSKRINAGLTDLFREHKLQKTYWALSKPIADSNPAKATAAQEFSVNNRVAPVRDAKKRMLRMVTVKSGGWSAETHFKVRAQTPEFDWIEASPVTGRTHQIRIHLAGVKRPIWGDSLYGGKTTQFPRLMLHARSLRLVHPITQKELLIEAPVPADFQVYIQELA